MLHQIVVETETAGDSRTMFRLRIDANVIAEGLTAAQAQLLVGEIWTASRCLSMMTGQTRVPRRPDGEVSALTARMLHSWSTPGVGPSSLTSPSR